MLAVIGIGGLFLLHRTDSAPDRAPRGHFTASAAGVETAAAPPFPRDFTFTLPLFRADSAWNQQAITATVLAENDRQVLATYRL
ncbi:MAG: hypothetical protein D6790_02830, partial [Caldilineae bacterium]